MKLSKLLSIATAGAALAAGAHFAAQTPATAVAALDVFPMPALVPGAEITMVEGRLSAVDTGLPTEANGFVAGPRTIVVNGTKISLPTTLTIDTTFDFIGDISFKHWLGSAGTALPFEADPINSLVPFSDPAGWDNLLSPVGGTVIVNAVATADANGMAEFVATSIYWDYGENVIVAPLISVDPSANTILAGKTEVKMNSDSRMPSKLLDLNFNPINPDLTTALQMLQTVAPPVEGPNADLILPRDTVSALCYTLDGSTYYATEVETMYVPASNGSDVVVIERAQWDPVKLSLEVRGWIVPADANNPNAPLATSVNITPHGLPAIVGVPTIPNLGPPSQATYRWRSANGAYPFNPGTVTVDSVGTLTNGTQTRPIIQ